MHHFMLVTVSLPDGGGSEEARRAARDLLLQDDSFCGEGGRFGSPLADWFVIGGRWSGRLRETRLGQLYQEALKLAYPKPPQRFLDHHKSVLDQLWHRFGGTGVHPLNRNDYDDLGFTDDAMLVDQFLYDHFLKPHAGSDRNVGGNEPTDFADLDDEPVDESFIGRKWLVVVDYHN